MGRFAEGYRRHMGEGGSTAALYAGFAAFFAGIALAVIGILVVVSGATLIDAPAQRNGLGIILAATGFPLFFLGLQLTLPSRLVIHLTAALGAAICFLGVVLFTQAWPNEFGPRGTPDRSSSIIATYAFGLVLLAATTGMALVINFVSRHVLAPGLDADRDIFADPDRPVTMDEVMRDIEREVARQRLTWGGMEEDRLPREYIKLKADWGRGATVSHGKPGRVTQTVARELDSAFEALSRLRGTDRQVTGEDDTATAIAALRALRRARQAEEEASWWYRFKRWLVALFTGRRAAPGAAPAAPGDRKKPKDEMEATSTPTPPPAPAAGTPQTGTGAKTRARTKRVPARKPRKRSGGRQPGRKTPVSAKRAAKKAPRKSAARTTRSKKRAGTRVDRRRDKRR